MSDLSAAAAALGVPEPIVQRSAAARAAETGMTVDEILAAWAGGGSIEAPVPAAPSADVEAPVEEAAEEEPVTFAPSAVETPTGGPAKPGGLPAASPTAVTTTVSGKPPVLVGKADNPIAVLAGVLGLFLAVFLVGLVGPALPVDEPGARSSELPYTETAEHGRQVYQSVGCAACHTQMIRPVVADVGLGAVTLSDSNQVLGTRRFGPDLSDAGSRLSGTQLEAIVGGAGGHPALNLSADDLESLVAYLVESKAPVETPAGAAPEGGDG